MPIATNFLLLKLFDVEIGVGFIGGDVVAVGIFVIVGLCPGIKPVVLRLNSIFLMAGGSGSLSIFGVKVKGLESAGEVLIFET